MHKEEGGTRESLHSARAEKKNALSHVLNPSYRPHVKPLPKHAPVILRYFGFFYSTNRNRGLPGGAKESEARKRACWCPKADRERVKREGVDDLLCSTAAVADRRRGEGEKGASLSFFFFFIFSGEPGGRGGCVVVESSRERQSETRDMMETTTAATTTGREAEEGTSSRETLENHPGNAGSRATEDLQEGQQLEEGKGDEAFGRGSALGGPDGIVVDASNPVVAHTPAARSLGLGKDPVSKVLGGGVAKALKPTSTAAARSEKKRRNEIRRRWARATDAKSTSLSSSSTLTYRRRLSFLLTFFLSSGRWTIKTGSTSCERCSPTP